MHRATASHSSGISSSDRRAPRPVVQTVNILGIWDGHDSGAALLQDGELRFAVNEERLSRRKLEVSFPARSIAACLSHTSLRPEQIQLVAASTSDPAKTLGRLWPGSKERYY